MGWYLMQWYTRNSKLVYCVILPFMVGIIGRKAHNSWFFCLECLFMIQDLHQAFESFRIPSWWPLLDPSLLPYTYYHQLRASSGKVVKNLPANTRDIGDAGSITGPERSPGVANSNLLQYSCLGNPMDKGAWRATVHRAAKSRRQLSREGHPASAVLPPTLSLSVALPSASMELYSAAVCWTGGLISH